MAATGRLGCQVESSAYPGQFLTVWTPCMFGEFVSPLSSLSGRRTCPAEICFPPFRPSKPSGQIIYDLTLSSGFVGSSKADLLGSDFPWLESEFAAVPLLLSVPPR
jgi:hypothetical protein